MPEKRRDIPLGEYLNVLSEEYLVAFIRSKTYPTIGDKKHWSRVAANKRRKIEDISDRNIFPNIFNDKPTYIRYFEKRNEDNLPEFLKTTDDIEYYYNAIGAEVVVEVDGQQQIGKIASYSKEQQSCGIEVSGKTIKFDIRNVRRFI